MKIFKTKDYSIFKFADFNRKIHEGNVKKLLELNKVENNLHLFPIVVDKKFVVIDGQHRLEVCKRLGSPVYYIFCDNKLASPEFIFNLNQAGRKHTLEDQICMLAKSGNIQAKKVLMLAECNKLRAVSILECLYCTTNTRAKEQLIQESEFNYYGLEIIKALNLLPFENISNRFSRAFSRVVNDFDLEPLRLAERLTVNWHLVFDAGREIDVYRNIVSTYNKGLGSTNRLAVTL